LAIRSSRARASVSLLVAHPPLLIILRSQILESTASGGESEEAEETNEVEGVKEDEAQQEAVRVCGKCGKEAENMKKCSACKMIRYCSPECQKGDWKAHKKSCKKAAEKE